MGANDTTKIQVNYKTASGTLINLYAEDMPDLFELLDALGQAAPQIKTAEEAVGAMQVVAGVPNPVPALYGAGAPAGPSCVHGAMIRRTGTNAKGAWGGYFCPTPQGTPDQCKPQFDKR